LYIEDRNLEYVEITKKITKKFQTKELQSL
jgi:hypothetical protein